MKTIIASSHAPKAVGPYSQAVEAGGALYVSGQLPIDAASGKMDEGIEAQTRRSLTNLGHILREAGYDYSDVVKTTVLLQSIGDFAAMNAVYAEFFTEGALRVSGACLLLFCRYFVNKFGSPCWLFIRKSRNFVEPGFARRDA